jgi:hypothetical protein
MHRAGFDEGDGGLLDHGIAGLNADGDAIEFNQGQSGFDHLVSLLVGRRRTQMGAEK